MTEKIKNIIAQAYRDTGLRIVQVNTTAPVPPLPYATYNITAPYTKDRGRPNVESEERADGLYLRQEDSFLVTLSFNVYTDKTETAIDQVNKLRRWFLFLGQTFLQDNGVAVVNVGNVENRTTFLIDSYEYKHGFDVQLRMTEIVETPTEWLETITFKGE
ncbi:phage neck terminator protein [Geobacillus sp. CCR]